MASKTHALFFPFDLFGGGGTASGAQLLADAFREMIDDNKRERVSTRARSYTKKVCCREFSFKSLSDYDDWRRTARQAIAQILDRDDFLIWSAGNHLGVLPLYEEAGRREKTLVIQFDGHLDIYNLADCSKELSHGNFLLHCQGQLPGIINVGHRELLLRGRYIRKYYRAVFAASELAVDPQPAVDAVRAACRTAERIIIDLDCDVLDPAYFPAVSHPLPFGLSPPLLLRFLDAAWSGPVVGLALSEFDPSRDQNDRSLATLMWLIEHVLLRWHESA
jgi:agmatinase